MSFMQAKERLYLTTDRKALVREGDPAAAVLYVGVGDEIPDSAVEVFGLVDGTIGKGAKGSGGTKELVPGQDKEQKPGEDKGAGGGAKGSGAADAVTGDDLTRVKFVGPKVAEGLIKAGIATFAQIAAIDPANPPAVENTNARTNWSGIVASAIELHEGDDSEQDGGAASGDAGADAGATDQQAN